MILTRTACLLLALGLGAPLKPLHASLDYEVYVTSVGTFSGRDDQIARFTPDGFPQGGIDLIDFETPFGLETDGTDLFVIVQDRLEHYATDGTFQGTIAASFTPSPITLKRDPFGNFFVTDTSMDSVLKLSPTGEVLVEIPNLNSPFGAIGDEDGNIYVSVRNQIEIYDHSGSFLDAIDTGFGFNAEVAIDYDGDRLFHFAQNAMLQTYDLSTGHPVLMDEIPIPTGGASLSGSYDPHTGHLFTGGVTGAYEITTEGALVQQYGRPLITFGVVAVPVPEPAAQNLIGCLACVLLIFRRWRLS